jgi:hypothetical protein
VTESLAIETETLPVDGRAAEHREQIDQRQQAFRDGQLQFNQLNQQVEQDKSAPCWI